MRLAAPREQDAVRLMTSFVTSEADHGEVGCDWVVGGDADAVSTDEKRVWITVGKGGGLEAFERRRLKDPPSCEAAGSSRSKALAELLAKFGADVLHVLTAFGADFAHAAGVGDATVVDALARCCSSSSPGSSPGLGFDLDLDLLCDCAAAAGAARDGTLRLVVETNLVRRHCGLRHGRPGCARGEAGVPRRPPGHDAERFVPALQVDVPLPGRRRRRDLDAGRRARRVRA